MKKQIKTVIKASLKAGLFYWKFDFGHFFNDRFLNEIHLLEIEFATELIFMIDKLKKVNTLLIYFCFLIA